MHRPLDDILEMEFATALLWAHGRAGLERVLDGLLRRATGSRVPPAGNRRALIGALAATARRVLTETGGSAWPERAMGLELEGLSPEDREFEIARQFVRFAADAAGRLAAVPAEGRPPHAVVQAAINDSARRCAPGLLPLAARDMEGQMTIHEYEQPFGETHQQHGNGETEFGETEYGEYGEYGEYEQGTAAEQWESEFGGQGEQSYGETQAMESPLNESEELQLAHELMEVMNEAELEQFLGNLVRRASRHVRGFINSQTGQALGGILKNVARTALPMVGSVVGTAIPGVGTAFGSGLGRMAAQMFEYEGEGGDRELQELEISRRFVRLAAASARNAALDRRGRPSDALARDAVFAAARTYAPGVARQFRRFARPAPWYWPQPVPHAAAHNGDGYQDAGDQNGAQQGVAGEYERPAMPSGDGQSGRWVRRGRKIVLLGL